MPKDNFNDKDYEEIYFKEYVEQNLTTSQLGKKYKKKRETFGKNFRRLGLPLKKTSEYKQKFFYNEEKICENCKGKHNGSYATGRFCCETCARSFSSKEKRAEINQKVSNKLKVYDKEKRFCKECRTQFIVVPTSKRRFCGQSCSAKDRNRRNPKILKIASKNGGLKSATIRTKRSKNEIYFSELCKQCFKNVKCNEPIFNGWDADVIIEDLKIAVLWNGKWHYEKLTKEHSLKQVKNRDRIKIKEISKKGYRPYVIKDMGSANKEFVEEQFHLFIKNFFIKSYKK